MKFMTESNKFHSQTFESETGKVGHSQPNKFYTAIIQVSRANASTLNIFVSDAKTVILYYFLHAVLDECVALGHNH